MPARVEEVVEVQTLAARKRDVALAVVLGWREADRPEHMPELGWLRGKESESVAQQRSTCLHKMDSDKFGRCSARQGGHFLNSMHASTDGSIDR